MVINTKCLAIALAIFGIMPILVQGQETILVRLIAANDGEEDVKSLIEKFRGSAKFRIESRILEFDRACELTEEQTQKLRVAAKGSLLEFVRNEKAEKLKQLRQFQALNVARCLMSGWE